MPEQLGARSDLAAALTVLRLLRGLEQEQLAVASGVSYAMIAKIELGLRKARPGALQAIVRALGVDPAMLDEMVALVRRIRHGSPSDPAQACDGIAVAGRPGAADRDLVDLQCLLRARATARPPETTLPLDTSRRLAPALWAQLEPYPHVARCALVLEAPVLHDAGLCELLCQKSIESAGKSARQARRLAELAVLAAELMPGEDGWRRRVEGYCRMHLANALRVEGTLPAAAAAFTRAVELWQAGAGHDPGLLNEARVLSLEASLRRERREFVQAIALFDRALAIDRWGETPSLLIGKSKALEEHGDIAGSIALLRQVAPLLDGERDLLRLFSVHLNLAIDLCLLGEYRAAEQALPEVRALALRLGNHLDDLRVGWLEAKIAAGLGRVDAAVAAFEHVRAGFERQHIPYDVALVTLELAELHASLGRTAEVKALVRTSAPLFEQQGVHREAQRALALFRRAADDEQATVELIRRILAYLERARRDPKVRYQELA